MEKISFILSWVFYDLKKQYAGTRGGLIWLIIHPLSIIALYSFIFCAVLKIRLPDSNSSISYLIYLLSGLIPWLAISECLNRSVSAYYEYERLIKKFVFPSELLPLSLVASSLVSQVIASIFLFLFKMPSKLFFAALVVEIMFMIGLSYLLFSLGKIFRDLPQYIRILLQFLFYLSPILYPLSSVPKSFLFLIYLNPLTSIIQLFQFSFNHSFSLFIFLEACIISLLLLFSGIFLYKKAIFEAD